MDAYSIEIAQRAYQDIRETYRYIAHELKEPSIAQRLIDKIDEAIRSLKHMPQRNAIIIDERLSREHYRKQHIENHLIFYIIFEDSKTVYVSRVLYARRDWQNLL